jgi:hypothetical protein
MIAMTAAIGLFAPSSTPGASAGAGQISLDQVANDTTGRFTESQRRQARHLQDLQTARAMVATVSQAMYRPKGTTGHHNNGGDTLSLSRAAVDFLNQLNGQIGAGQPGPSQDTAPQNASTIDPQLSFANSLQVGGFSISVRADAATGAYKAVVNGPDGFHYMSKGWASGGGWGGGGPFGPGMSMTGSQSGNVQYITISKNVAAATTVSASSSDIGSVSATVASAESDQITFADFTTGAITATEKRLSVNAASTSQSPPSAPVSIHA